MRNISEQNLIKITFFFSLLVHCLFLGMPGFNLSISQPQKPENIAVEIEIEKPPLLPKIDVMGNEKKLREIVKEELPESEPEPEPEPKSQPEEEKIVEELGQQSEEIVVEEAKPESLEEIVEVINPQPEPEPEPKSQPEEEKIVEELGQQSEEIVVEEAKPESLEEIVEVINPQEEAMLRYQDMVKQRIESCRRYPNWAKKQGFEGIVSLTFTVLSTGQVQDIKIIQSSGFNILDEEAIVTIKRANPFPPIPEEFRKSYLEMEVSIVFKLK